MIRHYQRNRIFRHLPGIIYLRDVRHKSFLFIAQKLRRKGIRVSAFDVFRYYVFYTKYPCFLAADSSMAVRWAGDVEHEKIIRMQQMVFAFLTACGL